MHLSLFFLSEKRTFEILLKMLNGLDYDFLDPLKQIYLDHAVFQHLLKISVYLNLKDNQQGVLKITME